MRYTVFTLFLLLTLLCTGLYAAAPAGVNRSGAPIHIKSSELFTDSNSRTATFIGKVVATQKDVTIYSDKMIVFYDEEGDEVDRVEAFGNVRIIQLNRLGIAGHAVYSSKEGKITLYINPKVYQGKDVVSGTVIVYLLDEEKSIVTGGPKEPVEVFIYPKEKGTGKDGD